MSSPLEKPEGLSWDAASVELPPVPMLPPGPDAMSMTISAVLPTLTTPLTASVAALVREGEHVLRQAGCRAVGVSERRRLGSAVGGATDEHARTARPNGTAGRRTRSGARRAGRHVRLDDAAGDAGRQGRRGGRRRRPTGWGRPAAAAPVGGGGQASRAHRCGRSAPHARDGCRWRPGAGCDERHDEARRERPPVEAAGPGDSGRHAAGPPPVAPPDHPRRGGEDDLARRM